MALVRTDIANPGDPDVPISPAVYINLDLKDEYSLNFSIGYEKAILKSDLSWIAHGDFLQYSSIAAGSFSVQQAQDRAYGFDFNYTIFAVGPGLKYHVPITEKLNVGFSALGQYLIYIKSDISVLERKFVDGIVTEENNYTLKPSGSNFSVGAGIELEYALNEDWNLKAFGDYRLIFRGERIISHSVFAYGLGIGFNL